MFDSSGHDVASGRRRDVATLHTPLLLASCKKSWPFQIGEIGKTIIHACVKCKPGAPLPLAIAKHGQQIIWACDANKFRKKEICEESLSWLGTKITVTSDSAKQTCETLIGLVRKNNQAAESFSKHSQGLKFGKTLPTSKKEYANGVSTKLLFNNERTFIGYTRLTVQRTVSVGFNEIHSSNGFIEVSHSVRACGRIPGQPLQCLDQKRSECIWSIVHGLANQFKTGRQVIWNGHDYKDQFKWVARRQGSCDAQILSLATSERL